MKPPIYAYPFVLGILTLAVPTSWGEPVAPYPGDIADKIKMLGYPPIPVGQNSPRGPNEVTHSEFSRAGSWGLASIGFFRVFNPIFQPINPKTLPCKKSVVVAVIDTGIDYTHPDLIDSLWVNSAETGSWTPPAHNPTLCRDLSCNGMDDDANGYVDDAAGWDFVYNIPAPYDTLGHGTHISGIIAANGKTATAGVCPGVSIMPIKYYDPSGPGSNNLSNLVKAIHYANINGADIINFSGGGVEPSETEQKALRASQQMGVLVVTAAGNQGRSNDLFGSYPANYPLDNIVSVAAIDSKGELVPSSNYGKRVHLAAPGLEILSAAPAGSTTRLTGTSQATAFVTGAAAFLMSQLGSEAINYVKIRSWLTRSAKPFLGTRKDSAIGHGVLSLPDAYQLLQTETKTKE